MFELFQYDFMQRALIAGVVIGVIAPMIGTFLVVRGYSLMSDTLAHVSLAGVAIGLLFGFNPLVAAIGTSVAAAFGIEGLRRTKRIFGESVLALFLSGSLAIAVVLFSAGDGLGVNVLSFLFGSITTVSSMDLIYIASLGLAVFLVVTLLFKELFLVSFDDELAQANGIPAKTLNTLLIVLAAITVSLSMRIVGVLLIGALMVIPVISAMQFGKSFKSTMGISVLFSVLSVISGLIASFYLDLASGGTIVIMALIIFILSLILNKPRQTRK